MHTDLYLTVTVPAHRPDGDLLTTAYALLAHDLLAADPDDQVKVRTDRINLVKLPGEPAGRYDYDTPDVRAWDAAAAAAAVSDPRER